MALLILRGWAVCRLSARLSCDQMQWPDFTVFICYLNKESFHARDCIIGIDTSTLKKTLCKDQNIIRNGLFGQNHTKRSILH